MKRIQRILLAFMLGVLSIQVVWADKNADLIYDSARDGDLDKVKQLVEQQGVDVNAVHIDELGLSSNALNIASYQGHLEIVKYLISKGANVNAKDSFGWTALISASSNGKLELVKYLISKGADVKAKSNDGYTALMSASFDGHLEVVKVLVESSKSGLFSFFSKGNINEKDKWGRTALMLASIKGHLEVVKYLVEKGVDINAQDNEGLTALNKAKTKEIMTFLESRGAKRMQIKFEYK
ncbi:ankyrin repeat domain-containing protein [Helicobacter sp. 23-1045]